MKITVVIPCFNDADTIAAQLEAVENQVWSGDWEVVISDNGSTDRTLAIVEQFKERLSNLQVVDSSDRRGAAHARNRGVREARGEIILFCDADDEVAPGWLEAMAGALSENDFVACRLDTEKLNERWLQETWKNAQRDHLIQGAFLPFAGSNTLGVRRSVHEAVGGFDESLGTYGDADYCWSIQLRGHKLHFVPETCVYYRYRTTLWGMYTQERLLGEAWGLLYKRYGAMGLRKPSRPLRAGVVAWLRLLIRLPQVKQKIGRAKWVRSVGSLVGHFQGSIRYGIRALY